MGKVALASVLLSFVIIFFGLVADRQQPVPTLDITPDLMPGSTHYRVYWCDYQHTELNALYCEAFYNNQVVSLVLNGRQIKQSTWPVQDMVVADFIVLWHTPTGLYYSEEMHLVRIYWGSRAIWLPSGQFSPDSRVFYVTYGYPSDNESQPWRGFILPAPAN